MITPNSYKVRHSIIAFLTKERTKQQIENKDISFCQYSIDELAEKLALKKEDIDTQLNMLWFDKLVFDINKEREPTKYIISPEGMAVASSMKLLNEGKMFNAKYFNNISTGFFQIVVGLTALLSLWFTYTNIQTIEKEISIISQQQEHTLQSIKELKESSQAEIQSYDSTKATQSKK
ncbi:MAG: hypothetical protein RLZZ337_1692 [Bacteroidota bacterium]|jgi:hypothetical protein